MTSSYPIPLCEEFNNNTLDVLITNRPSLIKQCYPQPDHEIVYVVTYIKTLLYQGYKRKLYNWSKADEKLKQDFIGFSDNFLNAYLADTSINDLWKEFKQACIECLQQAPNWSPNSSRKPWITIPT